MIEVIKLFNKYYNIENKIYNIPTNYDKNILYTLDNVFFFNKVYLNEDEKKNIYKILK